MLGKFKLSLRTCRNAVSEFHFRSNHLTWAKGAMRTLNAALESRLTEVQSPIRHSGPLYSQAVVLVIRLILPLQKQIAIYELVSITILMAQELADL